MLTRSFRLRCTAAVSVRSFSASVHTHANILALANAYRSHGHLQSSLDPLGLAVQKPVPELDPSKYGIDANAQDSIEINGIIDTSSNATTQMTVQQIIEHLKRTYSKYIGAEFMHLQDANEREWFARALESTNRDLSPSEKRNIHALLVRSEMFDQFMTVKFGSFKRYGCEGAESMMCGVETILTTAASSGVKDVVLGMPHRGRLNLLVGLLDYPARALFAKVKGLSLIPDGFIGDDDVTSHIAQSVTKKFDRVHPLHVSLLHNPSHLEAVNPVSQGKTRAKQDYASGTLSQVDIYNQDPKQDGKNEVLNLQLHGDAAFAGQGVVPESLLLANLPYFSVGGTVHMIVNNQIGFTTQPINSRSSTYSSDVVKMIGVPVLHVNADHPEEVVHACRIATAYRQKFKKDVLIDLIGFRKWGHNEVDEPRFTQPRMYEAVAKRDSIVSKYTNKLKEEGLLTDESMKKLTNTLQTHLETELQAVDTFKPPSHWAFSGPQWAGFTQSFDALNGSFPTGVDKDSLVKVGLASVQVPSSHTVHGRLIRTHIEARKRTMETGTNIDWATAEALALGTLLTEGYNVRFSGQDVQRGTFSHRHALLVDQVNESHYVPLNNIQPKQGYVQLCNSPLSEFAVLGYELGYSWESPRTLNIWEAQFGDFFNGAQIIIDTFINSSEAKWLRATGLTMLLPHGMDGTGPEHSSCRVERFLQLCADEVPGVGATASGSPFPAQDPRKLNMIIAWPSTPANYFHLLRRQMVQKARKPLVVVAPKTLLRLPTAVSTLEQMGPGTCFQTVIGDIVEPASVKSVVVCSGKTYYDIEKERKDRKLGDSFAIIRLEQISPFPYEALSAELSKYTNASKVIFYQEEHSNAGAYSFVAPRLQAVINHKNPALGNVVYVGRSTLAAPATGVGLIHKRESSGLMKHLFEQL